MSDLARRTENIRQRLEGQHFPLKPLPVFILTGFGREQFLGSPLVDYFAGACVLPAEGLAGTEAAELLGGNATPLTQDEIGRVRSILYPDTSFTVPKVVHDQGQPGRATARIHLDAQQETVARSMTDGVTVLTGVSGSGKSLIVVARARVLAREHPDWKIEILCFNKTLVRYLRGLVGRDFENIAVEYFTAWAARLGLCGDSQLCRAASKGIPAERYEAVLIDEVQDFQPTWLQVLRRTLKGKCGGMLLVGDKAQAIYGECSLEEALRGELVHTVDLTTNYRNTAEIGHFALEAVYGAAGARHVRDMLGRDPSDVEFPLHGEPVQLVWAQDRTLQAEALSFEIRRLVSSRQFRYGDIGVLYVNRWVCGPLLKVLAADRVPYYWVTQNRDTKGYLQSAENSVKLITVHSCKGLEFPVIFLCGVEGIKVPESLADSEPEDVARARVAYVGMTRAKDLLYVTYSKPNPIISRALDLRSWCEYRSYPDDFPVE